MVQVPIDDNFVKGLLVEGDATGADVVVKGSETTGAILTELVSPDGDSLTDDTNDAVKVTLATQLDATNDAIAPAGRTAGGNSTFNSTDLDESEEQLKATAGTIYTIYAWNMTAAPRWLKAFNATAANVSVGSTSADYDIMIPANANSDGAGFVIPIPTGGWPFDTAITLAATTGRGTTDSGAPGAGDVGVLVFYV